MRFNFFWTKRSRTTGIAGHALPIQGPLYFWPLRSHKVPLSGIYFHGSALFPTYCMESNGNRWRACPTGGVGYGDVHAIFSIAGSLALLFWFFKKGIISLLYLSGYHCFAWLHNCTLISIIISMCHPFNSGEKRRYFTTNEVAVYAGIWDQLYGKIWKCKANFVCPYSWTVSGRRYRVCQLPGDW